MQPPVNDTLFQAIPVAIVTASRFPHVLRQIRQLRAAVGGGEVPILLCVDGESLEAQDLSKLVGVAGIYHYNVEKQGNCTSDMRNN